MGYQRPTYRYRTRLRDTVRKVWDEQIGEIRQERKTPRQEDNPCRRVDEVKSTRS